MKKLLLALMTLSIMVMVGTPQKANAYSPHKMHMTDIGKTISADINTELPTASICTDTTVLTATKTTQTTCPAPMLNHSRSKYFNEPLYACAYCLTNSSMMRRQWQLHQHQSKG